MYDTCTSLCLCFVFSVFVFLSVSVSFSCLCVCLFVSFSLSSEYILVYLPSKHPSIHQSIHQSMGSVPVGVQYSPHYVSRLLGWLWYPGLPPVLVSIAFPFVFHISVFLYPLFFTCHCHFIRVSSLRPKYLHPFGRPFTYFIGKFLGFGTGAGTRCCGPRGGATVRMEQKSRSKFLPWP